MCAIWRLFLPIFFCLRDSTRSEGICCRNSFIEHLYILTMCMMGSQVHSLFRQQCVNIRDASQSPWRLVSVCALRTRDTVKHIAVVEVARYGNIPAKLPLVNRQYMLHDYKRHG